VHPESMMRLRKISLLNELPGNPHEFVRQLQRSVQSTTLAINKE
jgi:hypothetical protein